MIKYMLPFLPDTLRPDWLIVTMVSGHLRLLIKMNIDKLKDKMKL